MAELAVGQAAPDFTLVDENGAKVHLAELQGSPVVLMFYPLDFSPVCTGEMCEIRDHSLDIEPSGAKVYGISRDSRWTHKAFKEKEGLKIGLLADMNGAVAREYGAWNEQFGLAERLTVVIDKAGAIAFLDRSAAIPTPREQQKMLTAVAALA